MGKLSLNGKDLRKIGYPESKVIGIAIQVMHQYYKHSAEAEAIDILKDVLAAPDAYLEDAALGKIAAALLDEIRPKNDVIPLEQKRKEYAIYGFENIEMNVREINKNVGNDKVHYFFIETPQKKIVRVFHISPKDIALKYNNDLMKIIKNIKPKN